jgi:hypothetical protein
VGGVCGLAGVVEGLRLALFSGGLSIFVFRVFSSWRGGGCRVLAYMQLLVARVSPFCVSLSILLHTAAEAAARASADQQLHRPAVGRSSYQRSA